MDAVHQLPTGALVKIYYAVFHLFFHYYIKSKCLNVYIQIIVFKELMSVKATLLFFLLNLEQIK